MPNLTLGLRSSSPSFYLACYARNSNYILQPSFTCGRYVLHRNSFRTTSSKRRDHTSTSREPFTHVSLLLGEHRCENRNLGLPHDILPPRMPRHRNKNQRLPIPHPSQPRRDWVHGCRVRILYDTMVLQISQSASKIDTGTVHSIHLKTHLSSQHAQLIEDESRAAPNRII